MSSIRRVKRSEQSGGAGAGLGLVSGIAGETKRIASGSKSTIASAVAAAAASSTSPLASSTVSNASLTKAPSPASPTNGQQPAASKLVFGLSSRTNKLKHDEYAEKRRAANQRQQQQAIGDSKLSNRSTGAGSEVSPDRSKRSSEIAIATPEAPAFNSRDGQKPVVQVKNSKIRASKYGNFYKPQDLVSSRPSSPSVSPASERPVASNLTSRPSRSPNRELLSASRARSPARSDVQQQQPQLADRSRPKTRRSSCSPTRQKVVENSNNKTSNQQPILDSSPQNPNSSSKQTFTATNKIDYPEGMKERGGATDSSSSDQKPATTKAQQTTDQAQPAKRMQFNIPPPPQLSNSGGIRQPGGSVVSYAKSRIYDKPTRQQILSSPTGESLLNSGAIPAAISSGFKPPKQVNVSKAREKWEGGEPFAKCKSRQRLAAQANKKSLHGAWSMSSVVATQQMQLQQVMSNSRPSSQKNDTPVKILTRGSVLERVQQFEKSPSSSGSTSSGSTSSSSSGSSSPGSDGPGTPEDPGPGLMAAVAAAASMPAAVTATEAGLALQQPMEPAELRPSSPPSSKQALYKTRVSSIQTSSTQLQDPLTSLGGPLRSPPAVSNILQQRRPSLTRRRSSTANNSSIPKFYHPNGKPNTYEIELQKKNIVACFDKFPDRKALITGPTYRRHFHSIALACGFPEYFKEPLYLYVKHQLTKSNLLHNTSTATRQHRRSGVGPGMVNGTSVALNERLGADANQKQQLRPLVKAASIDNSTMEKIQNQTFITCEQFLVCWRQMIATAFDNSARFVHLLTFGKQNYLIPDDFVPLIQSIIDDHPGLKFLRAAPDFHMRYIQTVIARIYFCINKSWTGKISLAELRRSNLLAVLEVLSQEEDINQITDYFSYEHFYVIYCKFWNLDQDHDLLISREDLAKHNDAAISSRIIERIFMGIVSKQIQATGKMSYSDFVWFLLAEEDKKHPRSIEYWFRLMDIDGDGYISMYEMEYFYYEQTKRLELMNIEALPFVDSACQILDLVNPKEKNKISLADLKRTKLATIFFDTFINLEKYLEHESREFVSTRDVVQDGVVISDWDRYASEEYESLVTEESSV